MSPRPFNSTRFADADAQAARARRSSALKGFQATRPGAPTGGVARGRVSSWLGRRWVDDMFAPPVVAARRSPRRKTQRTPQTCRRKEDSMNHDEKKDPTPKPETPRKPEK